MDKLAEDHRVIFEGRYGPVNHWLPDHGKSERGWRSYKDAQRQRVYDSEYRTACLVGHKGKQFGAIEELVAYVNELLASEWWRQRFPHVDHCDIIETNCGHAWARCAFNQIGFPKNDTYFRTEKTVLHELAHIVVKNPQPGHGPLFARVYLDLVAHRLGAEWAEELERQYKRHKVRYTKYPSKPASQTQLVYSHGSKGWQHRVKISAKIYACMRETYLECDWYRSSDDVSLQTLKCLANPVLQNKAYTTIEFHALHQLEKFHEWICYANYDWLSYEAPPTRAANDRLDRAVRKYLNEKTKELEQMKKAASDKKRGEE